MFSIRSFYRRDRKTLVILISVFFLTTLLCSQDAGDDDIITAGISEIDSMESWLLFEKGVYSYDRKKYGESLNFFNKLIERHGVYPEAEYWIGRVFEQEGEYILAEKQYLKALEAEKILLIPHKKYEIQYRLADLYKNRENYDSYKQILHSIAMDELEENQLALANETSAINTLKRDGIDRMLLLFRHEFSYSIEAMNQLGIFYYKTGDYRAATSKLVYPVLSFFSLAVDHLRDLDPEFIYPDNVKVLLENHPGYVFDTLEKVIQRKSELFLFEKDLETLEILRQREQFKYAETQLAKETGFYLSGASYCLGLFYREPVLRQLIEEYNIYRTLYYLAASLYAEGYSEPAFKIWEIVLNDGNSHMWGRMSYEQILDPQIEIGLTIF